MIREGESPGDFQKRGYATGCPGIAASSPLLLEGEGLLATAAVAVRDRNIVSRNWLWQKRRSSERCRAEAVIPPPKR